MVDLFEDVAIGYGYGNIEPRLVRSMTVGVLWPEELAQRPRAGIRHGLGYSEIMSLPLTTEEHEFERLRFSAPDDIRRSPIRSSRRTTWSAGICWVACSKRFAKTAAARCRSDCSNSTTWSRLTTRPRPAAAEYRKLALAEIGRESGSAIARSVVDVLARELGWQAEYKGLEHPDVRSRPRRRDFTRRPADRRLG